MNTLIQIKDTIKAIAINHRQVNNFQDEKLWNFATSGTINYPVFWSIYNGVELRKGEKGYRFTFLCLDIIQKGRNNLSDIYSDTERTLSDIVSQLERGGYAGIDLKVESFNMNAVDEGYMDDEVAGHTVDLTIWTDYALNKCEPPWRDNSMLQSLWNNQNFNMLDENGNILIPD